MRAKEFIVANEATLKYPAEIRQIIDEMLPLSSSRQQTVDYYNRKLIADIRLQACLLQKELNEKNNAMQTPESVRLPGAFRFGKSKEIVNFAS